MSPADRNPGVGGLQFAGYGMKQSDYMIRQRIAVPGVNCDTTAADRSNERITRQLAKSK